MTALPLRIMVLDTWEEVPLTFSPQTTVAEAKQVALSRARVRRPAAEYLVKFRGAELAEGARTLAEAGVVANSPLIVLSRRRVPAR